MIFPTRDLAHQRAVGSKVIALLSWAIVAVALGQSLLLGSDVIRAVLPVMLLAGLQTAVWIIYRGRSLGRMLSSVLLMALVSMIVAGLSGSPYQTDMHMAYFAALAVVVIYCDWRAIIGGAATVAVHHLVLSFVLPDLVFPGSADLGRVIFHAVILIVEAAVLAWSAARTAASTMRMTAWK
ncbi:MAG: methyl-accepting chemotaxis protein, partial [Alphaproteobacteria bacterium]